MGKLHYAFLLLFGGILIACGDGSQNTSNSGDAPQNKETESVKESASEKESRLDNQRVEKMNTFINFYNNNIQYLDSEMQSYIDEFGTDESIPKKEYTHVNTISIDESTATKLQKMLASEPSLGELDESTQKITTIISTLDPLFNNAQEYYRNRDYLDDDYALGNELHRKILPQLPELAAAINQFNTALNIEQNRSTERELKRFKDEGALIRYNRLAIMVDIADLFNEIEKQELTTYEFIQKANPDTFREIYNRFNTHHKELRDAVKIDGQMEKEGFLDHQGSLKKYRAEQFINDTTNFKVSFLELMNHINENKPFENSITHPTIPIKGSIEDFNKLYKDIVKSYNSSN